MPPRGRDPVVTGPALKLLAEYTAPLPVNDLSHGRILRYARRCTYIHFMRTPFEAKIMQAHETIHEVAGDVRTATSKVGQAAETQAELNIALTAVCCAALLIACLLVRSQRTGVSA